jgi:hypothetical protein
LGVPTESHLPPFFPPRPRFMPIGRPGAYG